MAEISLHAYLDYLEDRLSRDAYSEVVAHCRHILESYPKHLATYKLLARALAAQGESQDAQDLFQRVLSSDPNDFIAHIGISDAYRESNNLDQAIWHLERAFEQVPNNMDLQEEIKRLYDQKGDRVPRKIHLTSGALARMYLKGKLYDQALAEIRTGIAKDPERLDLQVLLADALWQSHQEVNASKVAAEIHKRLPYSLDANRILAQLWMKYKRPSEARPFLERVGELDPYIRYRIEQGEEPHSDAFRLTMLDFSPEQYAARTGAADWVSQIGAIEKQKGVTGPLPAAERSSITDIFLTPSPETSSTSGPEEIPDWLRGTLGEQAPGESPASQPVLDQEPDWLREALGKPASPQPSEGDTGEDVPDWLKASLAGSAPTPPPPPTPAPLSARLESEGETPDWLHETLGETDTPSAASSPAPSAPAGDEEVPDWLQGLLGSETVQVEPPQAARPAPQDETVPGWLQELQADQPAQPGMERDDESVPDWLGDILSESPEGSPASSAQPGTPDVVSDDWLESFLAGGAPLAVPDESAEAPAAAEPTPSVSEPVTADLQTWDTPVLEEQPESDEQPLPDWLESGVLMRQELRDGMAAEEPQDKQEEEIPEWLAASTPAADAAEQAQPEAKAEAEEEMPDWLKPVMEESAAPTPVEPSAVEEPEAELPGWLQTDQLAQQQTEEQAEPEEEATLPEWLSGIEEPEGAGADDWLSGLQIEATPSSTTQPESESALDELPDWMKDEEEAEEAEELPAWMTGEKAEAAPTPAAQPEAESALDELPDWMKGEEEPEAAGADDWLAGLQIEAAPTPAAQPEGESALDELPDWMKGEEEAQKADESPAWMTGSEELAVPTEVQSPRVKLPDWLLEDEEEEEEAPTQPSLAPVESEEPEAVSSTTPDWLAAMQPPEGAEEPDWLTDEEEAEEPEAVSSTTPDWLAAMQPPEGAEEPDWLTDEEEPEPEATPSAQEEPALAVSTSPALEEESEVVPPNDEPMGEDESEGIPDWMLEGDLDDSDAAVKWLEEIAAKYDPNFAASQEAEAKDEEPVAEQAPEMATQADESLPEWLKDMPESDEELDWLREPLEGAGSPAAEQKPSDEEPAPSWLSMDEEEEEEAPAGTMAADEELPSWLLGVEEEEEEEAPTAQPDALSREAEDELAWLDEQVAAQGASPSGVISEQLTPDHPPVAAPPPPPPDAEAEPVSDEDLPEWMRGDEVKMEMERAETAPVGEFDELPELDVEEDELAWLDEALKAEGEAKPAEGDLDKLLAEEFDDEKLPSWLMEGEEEEEAEESPALAAAQVTEEGEEEETVPDWLTELELGEPTGEAAAKSEMTIMEGTPVEELAGEPKTSAPVTEMPEPETPIIEEPAGEEALPAWLQATSDTGVDLGLDEFLRAAVPAAREPERAPQAPPPPEPPKPAAPPVTAPLVPPARVEAPTAPVGADLNGARRQMQEGYTDDALNSYEQLVTANQSLDDTIADLSDYVKGRRPNPRAYRIIGDAMMAQGKLQDALDMYRRALDQF